MAMEPNAFDSQPLSPLSLSNTGSLQEVLDEKNDRQLSGFVNASEKFINNISQVTNKRRRQHNEPPAPRKKKQLRSAPQVEASALNEEMASALNATNNKLHSLEGQVNELQFQNMVQNVQLFRHSNQARVTQVVTHQNYFVSTT
jgi:hypothetical protein